MVSEARKRLEDLGRAFEAKQGAAVAVPKPKTKQFSATEQIRMAAKKMLEENSGDILKVTGLMEKLVWSDRNLRDALVEPMIRDACYNLVKDMVSRNRHLAWTGNASRAPISSARMVALARGTASSLMDWSLPGGKPLRNAMGSEISAAADFYQRTKEDVSLKERWLRMIAQIVPESEKLSDHVTEEQLLQFQKEAANA